MSKVREKLWIWGHEAGSHSTGGEGLGGEGSSRMTPAEGAFYLGVPNMIMVRYGNKPVPPFDTYARSFCPLKQVVWSVIGDSSCTLNNDKPDTEEVIRLAEKFPNVTGAIMDDMSPERLSLEKMTDLHRRLRKLPHPLDLWIVLYSHAMKPTILPYLEQSDVVTLWNWKQDDISKLAAFMDKVDAFIPPGKRKVLGCYMYDYGNTKPMLAINMQRQCEQGLQWLQEGRIDGMIFLASCICDYDLEAVEWTRNWISKVGDKEL